MLPTGLKKHIMRSIVPLPIKIPRMVITTERMLKAIVAKGTKVKICGGCAEARGLKSIPLIEGTEISTMAELTNWVVDSDKVITF